MAEGFNKGINASYEKGEFKSKIEKMLADALEKELGKRVIDGVIVDVVPSGEVTVDVTFADEFDAQNVSDALDKLFG